MLTYCYIYSELLFNLATEHSLIEYNAVLQFITRMKKYTTLVHYNYVTKYFRALNSCELNAIF